MSIRSAINDVHEFHRATEHPIQDRGDNPPALSRRTERYRLLREEYQEMVTATMENNVVEVADAYADMIYIILGSAIMHIGADRFCRVWDEVHRSNMAKVVDGKVIRRPDGKVLKPDGWTPPDIEGAFAPVPSVTDDDLRVVEFGPSANTPCGTLVFLTIPELQAIRNAIATTEKHGPLRESLDAKIDQASDAITDFVDDGGVDDQAALVEPTPTPSIYVTQWGIYLGTPICAGDGDCPVLTDAFGHHLYLEPGSWLLMSWHGAGGRGSIRNLASTGDATCVIAARYEERQLLPPLIEVIPIRSEVFERIRSVMEEVDGGGLPTWPQPQPKS